MNKRIWIVDDNPNRPIVERLKMVTTKVVLVEVENYCGTGMVVEFVHRAAATKFTADDYFILDVYMPVPNVIRLHQYWGRVPVHAQYCGFALAKWLLGNHAVNEGNIILCSAFPDYASKKKEFNLPDDLQCWPGWQTIISFAVRDWMGI